MKKRVETDEFEFETMPVVDTAKAKAKAKAKAPVQIEWSNVLKKSRGAFAKNIKKLDALLLKVRQEKAQTKAGENAMTNLDKKEALKGIGVGLCDCTENLLGKLDEYNLLLLDSQAVIVDKNDAEEMNAKVKAANTDCLAVIEVAEKVLAGAEQSLQQFAATVFAQFPQNG